MRYLVSELSIFYIKILLLAQILIMPPTRSVFAKKSKSFNQHTHGNVL